MSPYLGTINPNDLSTGVKCVLILRYTDKIINLLNCGDNCLELIKRISLENDITVSMSRFVDLYALDGSDVLVMIINNNENKIIRNWDEYSNYYSKYYDLI